MDNLWIIYGWSIVTGWWLTKPLWKIWKSIGMTVIPIYGKMKNVPNHQQDRIWPEKLDMSKIRYDRLVSRLSRYQRVPFDPKFARTPPYMEMSWNGWCPKKSVSNGGSYAFIYIYIYIGASHIKRLYVHIYFPYVIC